MEKGQMLPLLPGRARSEYARSMRAAVSTYTHSAVIEVGERRKAAFGLAMKYFNRAVLSSEISKHTDFTAEAEQEKHLIPLCYPSISPKN